MKEAFDHIGLFLHAPKVENSLPFHALFREMLEFSHDSRLEISPYPFVRIEFRRVAGEQVKRKLSVKGFHKTSNFLCLVTGVTVDDEENSLLGSVDKTLDELDELLSPDCALYHHESEHTFWADCRDHIESESSSCCSHNRSISFRRPCSARVIVGSNSSLVSEVDFSFAARCGALDCGEFFLEPFLNSLRVLLRRSLKRALCSKTKLIKHATHGSLAEFDAELFFDERRNHLTGPKREGKFELKRSAHSDCGVNPLEHLAVELWLATATFACIKRVPTTATIKSKPIINRRPADTKCLSNHLRALTIFERL